MSRGKTIWLQLQEIGTFWCIFLYVSFQNAGGIYTWSSNPGPQGLHIWGTETQLNTQIPTRGFLFFVDPSQKNKNVFKKYKQEGAEREGELGDVELVVPKDHVVQPEGIHDGHRRQGRTPLTACCDRLISTS